MKDEDKTKELLINEIAELRKSNDELEKAGFEFRKVEQEREVTIEFLRLVNSATGTRDMIRSATTFFQKQSGCEAVGVRLKEGDDFPYFEARGFPKEFVLAENNLCARDSGGKAILDGCSNPVIECMCGNVICGRFDPSKPFFTPIGSFWTNSTTELLASTTKADRQARTRNRCNGEGYESVALIPLRVGQERFGLLQLNDRRKGLFSPEIIRLWERLADQLALTLAKFLAEDARQESEKRYRSLFDNMLDGYAYCKMLFDEYGRPLDFVYLDVNNSFRRLTGLKNVVGKKVTDVIPGIRELYPELFEIYGRVSVTGRPERFEIEMKPLAAWLSISVYSTEREYFVAVFDNITERKLAEVALIGLDRRNKLILNCANEGIAGLDTEGRITFINPAGAGMCGYSVDELIGKSMHQTLHHTKPDGSPYPEGECPHSDALRLGTSTDVLNDTFWTKDGTGLLVDAAISPAVDGDRVVGAVITFRDVTERRKALTALELSEKRYRSVFEQSRDAIVISTPEGKLVDINPEGLKLFGYGSRDEAFQINNVAEVYVNLGDRSKLIKAYEKYGVVNDLEVQVKRKSGEMVIVLLNGTIAPNETGQGIVFQTVVRDITEQKRLKEQLLQSQKMESIGLLAGGIAHDLNNILGAMMGFTTILQMQIKDDHPARKNLDHLPALTDRAAILIKNLMAFSRKQVLDIKPASLNDIVSTIGKLLSRVIGEDIKLILKLSDKDIVVNADAGQIELALMNLATNARDAMPEGGTLTISTGSIEVDDDFINMHGYGKPGKYALLTVEDTGMGIDEQTREKIFEPFFTTKGEGKGTGLGLAMVYGTIKQHEGYIYVYSEPGEGTTFRVYLPALDAGNTEKKTLDIIPRRGGTETILVVEDEASLRMSTRCILEKLGYKVIEAEDGNDAVNKFKEHHNEIDLVLMDVIMPRKSGKEAYGDMRNIQPDVKVIFTSGHTGDLLTSKKIAEEGLYFIPKPILPKELFERIRDVLDKDKA